MTVLAATSDRLVEQLARRIRGPLRAAGPAGLPLATIKAIAGYGWTAEQITLALEHLGAVARKDAFTVQPSRNRPPLPVDALADALRARTCGCARPLARVPSRRSRPALPAMRKGPAAMTGQLLTAEQLAERWQVTTHHVYRLAREGRIPVVELGRYKRFKADAIERFEDSGDVTAERAT